MGAGRGGISGLGGARRYEETKRILDRQATVMNELRNRANILLAADAIVATLFGASALGKGHLLGLEIAALVAFGLGIAACVAILWPAHDDGDLVDPDEWGGRRRWPSSKRPRRWQVTFEPDDVVDFEESQMPLGSAQSATSSHSPGSLIGRLYVGGTDTLWLQACCSQRRSDSGRR